MKDAEPSIWYAIAIGISIILSFASQFYILVSFCLFILYYFKTKGFIATFKDKIIIETTKDVERQKTEADAYCKTVKEKANTDAKNIIAKAQDIHTNLVTAAKEKSEDIINSAQEKASTSEAKYNSVVNNAQNEANSILFAANDQKSKIQEELLLLEPKRRELYEITEQISKLNASYETQKKKLADAKKLCKNAQAVIETYFRDSLPYENITTLTKVVDEIDQLDPTVTIKANALDYPDLRKEFNRNQKLIKDLTQKYTKRYTLKTYAAIYKLMVLALSAELQNIIYCLRYDKLEVSINALNEMFDKYINIATEGNKTISPTLLAFIGEIKGLYIDAVRIEYQYYVKREHAKEEQAALREQMRQEAEERRMLEEQKKQVLKEESKYQTEINNITNQLSDTADSEQVNLLKARLAELESQLKAVNDKKEEIINLQNGKAGYVYIISNLGSFGDKMFKVGMTRRLDPQDRVNELGDASVPFKFDVHSFIFSEDASSLETKLHRRLEKQRVNKINNRKEFFYSTVDELEALVNEIEPTAEFNRTMLAEQYRQSLTIAEEESTI